MHEATVAAGAYPSPLNYNHFPKSVCTSVNEVSQRPTCSAPPACHAHQGSHVACLSQVICHGIPDRRPLQDGDIVNVDVTACYKGYHGDLNETFVVGEVDEESKRLIRVTAEVCCCMVFKLRMLLLAKVTPASVPEEPILFASCCRRYSRPLRQCSQGCGSGTLATSSASMWASTSSRRASFAHRLTVAASPRPACCHSPLPR